MSITFHYSHGLIAFCIVHISKARWYLNTCMMLMIFTIMELLHSKVLPSHTHLLKVSRSKIMLVFRPRPSALALRSSWLVLKVAMHYGIRSGLWSILLRSSIRPTWEMVRYWITTKFLCSMWVVSIRIISPPFFMFLQLFSLCTSVHAQGS